jgi:hypothetical protein
LLGCSIDSEVEHLTYYLRHATRDYSLSVEEVDSSSNVASLEPDLYEAIVEFGHL